MRHIPRSRNVARTTSRSYTSTAFCVAVATGYSYTCSNEPINKFSANVDGTISGARPYTISPHYIEYAFKQKERANRPWESEPSASRAATGGSGRTMDCRISLRRGLLEARTTCLPLSFLKLGMARACGRTGLYLGAIVVGCKLVEGFGVNLRLHFFDFDLHQLVRSHFVPLNNALALREFCLMMSTLGGADVNDFRQETVKILSRTAGWFLDAWVFTPGRRWQQPYPVIVMCASTQIHWANYSIPVCISGRMD